MIMKLYGIKEHGYKSYSGYAAVIQAPSHVDARGYYVNQVRNGNADIFDIVSEELNGMGATHLLHNGTPFYNTAEFIARQKGEGFTYTEGWRND
ncbi:hypothetical protein WBU96_28535 [Bacillus albus]|uniref:hypothetical protein n=1 Tax=Bacillus albus TaxID=2026189 RepID=UPI003015509B